jgi:hypothetical protein
VTACRSSSCLEVAASSFLWFSNAARIAKHLQRIILGLARDYIEFFTGRQGRKIPPEAFPIVGWNPPVAYGPLRLVAPFVENDMTLPDWFHRLHRTAMGEKTRTRLHQSRLYQTRRCIRIWHARGRD